MQHKEIRFDSMVVKACGHSTVLYKEQDLPR